jgi:hypothetical protein
MLLLKIIKSRLSVAPHPTGQTNTVSRQNLSYCQEEEKTTVMQYLEKLAIVEDKL